MLSAANQWIVESDKDLIGLGSLLDTERAADILIQCGVPLENEVRIDYLRYKPGRRCIGSLSTCVSGAEQRFVMTAFPKLDFLKQQARTSAAEAGGKCWQDPVRRIRIDRFPFDLGLRHVEKCFESSERSRLLHRVLGKQSRHDQIRLETLAYKPSRRYVAAGTVETGSRSLAETAPANTFKFYSGSQFEQTLRRLKTIQSAYCSAPRIVASHEHYKVIAIEWIEGDLLADSVAHRPVEHGADIDALLSESGAELARLHRCPCLPHASPAAAAHGLNEIASYIGFICPSQARLAIDTVNATAAQLSESREQSTMIHGDFYAKQVLITRGTTPSAVRFIDFDQAGLGNPYQDVGNFVAKLYWQTLSLGQKLESVEPMAESFLLGYRSDVRSFDEPTYRAHLAAGLIRCATHPFRRGMVDWPDAMRQLLVLAQNVLQATHCSRSSVSIA